MVIKAHDTITADIASTANKVIEGVTIWRYNIKSKHRWF